MNTRPSIRTTSRKRSLPRALALAACLFASTVSAQAIETPAPVIDGDTRVLPVWSNASGRVEALLLLDPVDPMFGGNSLDRVLNAPRTGLGLGTRVRLDNGSQVRGALQFDPDGGLALLCDGPNRIAGAIASLGEHCLLATLGNEDPLLAGSARGAHLGLGWESPAQFLDLSFGLSWLDYDARSASLPVASDGMAQAPALLGIGADTLGAWAQRLESQNLRLDSLINLGPQSRMLLGGDLGRSRLVAADGTELQWETAALTFGLGFGDFTGRLTGRLIELPRQGQHWNALDIGVSWRTPWRGELSLGARNVLGNGDVSRWPLRELPAVEDPSARVPYVQYQQDL